MVPRTFHVYRLEPEAQRNDLTSQRSRPTPYLEASVLGRRDEDV